MDELSYTSQLGTIKQNVLFTHTPVSNEVGLNINFKILIHKQNK